MARRRRSTLVDLQGLKQLATIFGQVVDAKSPYTTRHSVGVAHVAGLLAQQVGMPSDTVTRVEVAGLLHDLGKLKVPDEVLDKPAALDEPERVSIARHSFYTFDVLQRIHGLDDIATWAADHHESLLGDGYPFGKTGAELPMASRVLAVADALQAMVQNRPYRRPMTPDRVRQSLQRMAASGRLDRTLVEVVDQRIGAYWRAAAEPAMEAVA